MKVQIKNWSMDSTYTVSFSNFQTKKEVNEILFKLKRLKQVYYKYEEICDADSIAKYNLLIINKHVQDFLNKHSYLMSGKQMEKIMATINYDLWNETSLVDEATRRGLTVKGKSYDEIVALLKKDDSSKSNRKQKQVKQTKQITVSEKKQQLERNSKMKLEKQVDELVENLSVKAAKKATDEVLTAVCKRLEIKPSTEKRKMVIRIKKYLAAQAEEVETKKSKKSESKSGGKEKKTKKEKTPKWAKANKHAKTGVMITEFMLKKRIEFFTEKHDKEKIDLNAELKKAKIWITGMQFMKPWMRWSILTTKKPELRKKLIADTFKFIGKKPGESSLPPKEKAGKKKSNKKGKK